MGEESVEIEPVWLLYRGGGGVFIHFHKQSGLSWFYLALHAQYTNVGGLDIKKFLSCSQGCSKANYIIFVPRIRSGKNVKPLIQIFPPKFLCQEPKVFPKTLKFLPLTPFVGANP